MTTARLRIFSFQWRNYLVSILAFFYIFGLQSGIFFSKLNEPYITSLMRSVASAPVSIVGSLVLAVIPFLISAVCFYTHTEYFIFPVSLVRGFFYGYSLCASAVTYGTAGWLVCGFLFFSDHLLSPLLLWYWARACSAQKHLLKSASVICCIFAAGLSVFDSLVVSPFFRGLPI